MIATWLPWALGSAAFAALTAIFAKIGIENINSDFATLIRTGVILLITAGIVVASGAWQPLGSISRKTWIFLVLSGLATGGSWLCYFRALKLGDAARVAPIDKLSVVLVAVFSVALLGERLSMPNWLGVALIAGGAVLVAYRGEGRWRRGGSSSWDAPAPVRPRSRGDLARSLARRWFVSTTIGDPNGGPMICRRFASW